MPCLLFFLILQNNLGSVFYMPKSQKWSFTSVYFFSSELITIYIYNIFLFQPFFLDFLLKVVFRLSISASSSSLRSPGSVSVGIFVKSLPVSEMLYDITNLKNKNDKNALLKNFVNLFYNFWASRMLSNWFSSTCTRKCK
jgi:hypothetical protein